MNAGKICGYEIVTSDSGKYKKQTKLRQDVELFVGSLLISVLSSIGCQDLVLLLLIGVNKLPILMLVSVETLKNFS